MHRLSLCVFLFEHLEHVWRHIFPAERAIIRHAVFLKVQNVLLGLPKAARMHPLLAWTFTLEHLLRGIVIVLIIRLTTNAIEFVARVTFLLVVFGQLETTRVVAILWSDVVDALCLPIDVFVSVNLEVFRGVWAFIICLFH